MKKCAKCRRKCGVIPLGVLVVYDGSAVKEYASYGRCVACLEKAYGGRDRRLTFVYPKRRR